MFCQLTITLTPSRSIYVTSGSSLYDISDSRLYYQIDLHIQVYHVMCVTLVSMLLHISLVPLSLSTSLIAVWLLLHRTCFSSECIFRIKLSCDTCKPNANSYQIICQILRRTISNGKRWSLQKLVEIPKCVCVCQWNSLIYLSTGK